MTYTVRIKEIDGQPIAAVRRLIAITDIGTAWKPALDLVWSFLRQNPALRSTGHNVFVYRRPAEASQLMQVEFGVQVDRTFNGEGEVVASSTPAGEVACAVAEGYSEIAFVHDAILDWCVKHGRQPAGVSIEIYGDPDESNPATIDVEVLYLLRDGRD